MSNEYLVTKVNENLSDHFTFWEMIRSDKAARKGIDNYPPEEYVLRLRLLCDHILEPVREHYGIPFRPNSGYRSKRVNKLVGGSKNSKHITAEAVDFEVPGISNYELAQWCRRNLSEYDVIILECYTHGIENSGWVHASRLFSGNNRRLTFTYDGKKYTSGLWK